MTISKYLKLLLSGMMSMVAFTSLSAAAAVPASSQNQQYVWIASLSTLPEFLAHDYPALKEQAARLGVKIAFAGPTTVDVNAENAVLNQWIAKKPAGILFMPFGEGSDAAIDKAIAAGIPVVAVDGDAPHSKRIAFVGTNWKELGREQARVMGKLLNGKGKVMLSAIIPNNNTNLAIKGYKEEMAKKFPAIEVLGVNNDSGDEATAAKLATQTIQQHPDIAGFSGIDNMSGPGIADAVRTAGKVGVIKVTSVDDNPATLQAIQQGVIDATIVQKREAFETFGLRILYAYNHPGYSIGDKFAEAGFNMVPNFVYTGTLVIDKSNLPKLLEIHKYVEQVNKSLK